MIAGKKILSVITARAGSKGIKNKNVRLLNDVPLVNWSIDASVKSKYIDLTAISSNCNLVEDVVGGYVSSHEDCFFLNSKNPLIFIQRPEEFATDTSKNEEALIHTLDVLHSQYIHHFDIVVNLQPTSPIRNNNLIDQCIERFIGEQADSLFTGSSHTPFFFRIENNEVIAEWDYKKRKMRQELEDSEIFWHDDGSVYISSAKLLKETGCRMGGKISIFPTNKYQSLQIDTEEDFQLIEKLVEANVITLL
jgi:CMP-N,N'-diacetyllegionaminic acid synthase